MPHLSYRDVFDPLQDAGLVGLACWLQLQAPVYPLDVVAKAPSCRSLSNDFEKRHGVVQFTTRANMCRLPQGLSVALQHTQQFS